jgi:hypothetical protein
MIAIYKPFRQVNYVNYGRFDGYDENGASDSQFYGKRNSTFFGVFL